MKMSLNHEDITELKELFDDRYVLQSDCNENQNSLNKKLAKDDKRIEIIMHDFKIIKWLITAVAGASGGSLITALIELFAK
jgi:hypothetical protein